MKETKERFIIKTFVNMMIGLRIKRSNEVSLKPELALLVFERNIVVYTCFFDFIYSIICGVLYLLHVINFWLEIIVVICVLYTLINAFIFKIIEKKQKLCEVLGINKKAPIKLDIFSIQFLGRILYRVCICFLIALSIEGVKALNCEFLTEDLIIANLILVLLEIPITLIVILSEIILREKLFKRIDKKVIELRNEANTINIDGTSSKALLMLNGDVIKDIDLRLYNIIVRKIQCDGGDEDNLEGYMVAVCSDGLSYMNHDVINYALSNQVGHNKTSTYIDSIIIPHNPHDVVINIDNISKYI